MSCEFPGEDGTLSAGDKRDAKFFETTVVAGAVGGRRDGLRAARPPTGNNIMNPLARWNQSRWNQLNELEDLRHTLGSRFSSSGVCGPAEDVRLAEWLPGVVVSEDARGYVKKAELPRVKKK